MTQKPPSGFGRRSEDKEVAEEDSLAEFQLDPLERRYMGPLLKYMTADKLKNVKEVIINQPGEVGYEHIDGSWEFVEAPELTLEQLEDAARMIANRFGQIYSPDHPIMACKMPQGHRVQIVAGSHAGSGFSMAVRIQRKQNFTIDDFKFSEDDKNAVLDAVKNKQTILISGGTSSGKTSFMNVLLRYIPDTERLITLEDVPELEVPQKNVVSLLFTGGEDEFDEGNISEILNACLRMRPDRILLGEVRKENAFAFCSAINTGHEGSMATIHANTPATALDAVINRVLMNGDAAESALAVLRRQLIADIYGVVQLNRKENGIEGYFKVLRKDEDI